jgi:transketolase
MSGLGWDELPAGLDITESVTHRCLTAARQMRIYALEMSLAAGPVGAHLGGGLSMIEIIAALYFGALSYHVENPRWELRDRFILSKGHGALAYYAALSLAGFFDKKYLATFKSNDTFLTGHPHMDLERGIEFSSGSLGQGLSLGVGTALALRSRANQTSRVYVLVGDGEINEGSIWEAAMSAAHFKLSNLTLIVDKNELQYDGGTREVLDMGNLAAKWKSFGWTALTVDGHDLSALLGALQTSHDKPLAIIANTVKGKGVSFMENNRAWHHCRLTQAQFDQAMAEQSALEPVETR